MREEHLSFEELALVADGEGTLDAAGEAHLAHCDACRSDLALLRRLDDSWEEAAADDEGGHDPTRESVLEFAQRIQQEDEAARALLKDLLAENSGSFALGIERRGARYRTGGVVRVLCNAARAALGENALKALILADEAIEIARNLPDDLYPSGHVNMLRGNAWKERANALRLEASYPAALDAVDQAERAYRRLPLPEFYLAMCDYVRASVFARMDRFHEARAYARRSGETFLAFRDFERFRNARSIEAQVLFDNGAFVEAHNLYEELLTAAEADDDDVSASRFKVNLAAVEVELGMLDSASVRLSEAVRRCDELKLHVDGVHARWIVGKIPLRGGRPADAVPRLLASLADCRAIKLAGMETAVALDLAEAYALLGRPADVARICAEVIQAFVSRGQLTSAMTAFAFLRDSGLHGTVSAEDVRYVKRFVDRLDRQPKLLFAPPPR